MYSMKCLGNMKINAPPPPHTHTHTFPLFEHTNGISDRGENLLSSDNLPNYLPLCLMSLHVDLIVIALSD